MKFKCTLKFKPQRYYGKYGLSEPDSGPKNDLDQPGPDHQVGQVGLFESVGVARLAWNSNVFNTLATTRVILLSVLDSS